MKTYLSFINLFKVNDCH